LPAGSRARLLLVPIPGRLADLQRLFAIEGVGEFIWEPAGRPRRSAEQIQAGTMAEEFEVSPEHAGADLQEFLAELEDLRLIAEEPGRGELKCAARDGRARSTWREFNRRTAAQRACRSTRPWR